MDAKAYVHFDPQGAGASARNFSVSPKKPMGKNYTYPDVVGELFRMAQNG